MALDVQRAPVGIDVTEHGKDGAGQSISVDRRLYVQLLAFGDVQDSAETILEAITRQALPATFVLYADLNDPRGIGLLVCSDSADFYVDSLRPFLQTPLCSQWTPKPEYTMFGRTYSLGYEENLLDTLIYRPLRKVVNPDTPWAIWYPLRRKGEFERLSAESQRTILMEHGGIGMAYGRAGLGTDIRLASHGLDKNDNDFTVALLGRQLSSLSKIVERMRKTEQTSLYLERLGPFFVGKNVGAVSYSYKEA